MRFDIITLFPEMFSAIKEEGVIARAIKKSIISINEWQLRDFSENKYKNVDDKPMGAELEWLCRSSQSGIASKK